MAAVVGLALTACAPDPYDGAGAPPTSPMPTQPTPPRDGPPPVQVQALDNNFRARDVTVAVGTEVVWSNVGRNDHDVTPVEFEDDQAAAPWGAQADAFKPGGVYARTFDTPGVYAYVCTIHGVGDKGMAGTITVTT